MPRRSPTSRGSRGYRPRQTNTRSPRQRFLILCEGERTEPAYFESFRTPKVVLRIEGIGTDPLDIIRKAKRRQTEEEFDQTWCVFDRDAWKKEQFNQAIAAAERSEIRVAYSNEAFELWYLLHFHYCDVATNRRELVRRLTGELGSTYRKNDADIHAVLQPYQPTAIKHAQRLLELHGATSPADANPSTTVHLLVQELNKHAQP